MKKVLSMVLAASVIMANAAAVSAEENETLYQTIDISSMANKMIYAKKGDTAYKAKVFGHWLTDATGIDIDRFKNLVNRNNGALQTAHEKSLQWDEEWTDEKTENVLNFGGVRYKMNVETNKNTAIATSGEAKLTGVDVPVASGSYTQLKLLASGESSKGYFEYTGTDDEKAHCSEWENRSKLALRLDYTDGSFEFIDSLLTIHPVVDWYGNPLQQTDGIYKGDSDSNFKLMPSFAITNYSGATTVEQWWNGIGGSSCLYALALGSDGYSDTNGAGVSINEYTVNVDSSKILKNIHLVGSAAAPYNITYDNGTGNIVYSTDYSRNNGMYNSTVYAITAVTDTDTLTQSLNAAVAEIEQAKANGNEITKEMIEKVTAIADEITALGKTVPADMAAKIKEYKEEYDRSLVLNNNKSVTVDLTENGANVALSAKQGDTGYQASLLRSSTGIDVDRFKQLVDRNGGKLKIAKNKELKWNSEWTDGQTTNTLKFGDTDYYFDLSCGGKKTFIKTGEKEYWDKGADIKLEQGYYDNIKILASAGQPVLYKYKDNDYNTWGEMSKLAVKLDYADGTWDIIDNIYTLYGEKNGATWFNDPQKAATGVTTDEWWNGFGNFYTISNASSNWGAGNIENAYGDNNGAAMYMNEYTIPVNNKKLLVNMEIVGTRANPAGVTVDESGNVLYNDPNAVFISDGWGVYNDAVYAVTGVVNGKSMREALLAEISYDSFNKAFKLYKAQGYPVDDELFAKFKALNGYEAYFEDMSVNGINVSAKLSAFENSVTGVCIAAVYNDDNSLSECSVLYNVNASTDTPVDFVLKNPADGKTVKLFFLDSFNTLKPFAISETN